MMMMILDFIGFHGRTGPVSWGFGATVQTFRRGQIPPSPALLVLMMVWQGLEFYPHDCMIISYLADKWLDLVFK